MSEFHCTMFVVLKSILCHRDYNFQLLITFSIQLFFGNLHMLEFKTFWCFKRLKPRLFLRNQFCNIKWLCSFLQFLLETKCQVEQFISQIYMGKSESYINLEHVFGICENNQDKSSFRAAFCWYFSALYTLDGTKTVTKFSELKNGGEYVLVGTEAGGFQALAYGPQNKII